MRSLIDGALLDCLEEPLSDYALKLLDGVSDHKDELDSELASLSENWSIERMPVMDLNILRIALFEMKYVDDVPISVSINEAVELAKDFGGEDNSPKFINGMLGNIARQMEGEDVSQAISEDAVESSIEPTADPAKDSAADDSAIQDGGSDE